MSRSHSRPNTTYDSISLSRALSALSSKLLTPTPSPILLHSPYERTKTAANIEYARTLLLRLEHSTASVRVQSRKHEQQKRLAESRSQLKQLGDRLYEIGQADKGHGIPNTQPDEAILRILGKSGTKTPEISVQEVDADTHDITSYSAPIPASETTSSLLRSRNPISKPSLDDAPSTTSSEPNSKSFQPSPAIASKLESDSTSQYQLTESMISLARRLNASAKKFQDELEADDEVVAKTEGALGKNQAGMSSATKRMGVLSKMSEGRWWWGRMVLYAGIVALWVLALLIVFVGPKLRF